MRHIWPLSLVIFAMLLILTSSSHSAEEPKSSTPKGEVTQYTFDTSKIFPGTTRPYWVYVPKQYDPAKPACVYVNQDGLQFNATCGDKVYARKVKAIGAPAFMPPLKPETPRL